MSKHFLSFAIVFGVGLSHAEAARKIRQSDVVTNVGNENYRVYENAIKVYQAKVSIEKARADLLPRLSLWSLAGVMLDPLSIVDRVTDIAPFLVPANWFRVQESKLLYLAEKEGYRALWANEVNTAKTLYRHVLFDEQLYAQIQASTAELERIHRIVKTRELFGGAKPGSARDIEIRILGLKEDAANLRVLLALEKDELTYALGFTAKEDLLLAPVPMPDFQRLTPLNPQDHEARVLTSSPERRQFDHFLSVLGQIKKEIDYAFLGASPLSRGVLGGVFDNLPVPNGLGFSKAASLKIVKAQRDLLRTQRTGVEEVLRRQLRAVTTQYNSDLENFGIFKRRMNLARQSKEALLRRLALGEPIEVLELSEVSRNQILAETALLTLSYRVLNSADRLQRLRFEGDYSQNPPFY